MIITKVPGTPYWSAKQGDQEFLGYSIYEAIMRCVEHIWKYSSGRQASR